MAFFYSAEAGGFFHDAIHDQGARPADTVAISDAEHATLFKAQSEGGRIAPGPDGRPIITEQLPMTAEAAMQALRCHRDALLRDSDHTQIPDFPISEGQRSAWAIYRQQLRDLPETTT